MKHEAALAGAYAAVLLLLGTAGAFVPASLNWGFHALGFLPGGLSVLFAVIGCGVIILGSATAAGESAVGYGTALLARHPWRLLLAAGTLFTLAAVAFRISVPLLGDSYLITNNYLNTLRGEHLLNTYSEPLAMYFFWALIKLFGAADYAAISRVFFFGDLLLGLGFILNIFLIARRLFGDPGRQLLLFVFLASSASLQLFFGYVESYPVVLYALSLFVLTVVSYESGRLPFVAVALMFLVQMAVHFLNILLAPLLLVLAAREYRERGPRGLLLAGGAAAGVTAALFAATDLPRYLPRFSHVHYLSLTGPGDEFQAYPLVSLFHLIDLANLALLVMPFGLLILAIILSTGGIPGLFARETLGFALTSLAFLCFFCVVKYDLGTAKDWDIAATFAFPLSVFAGRKLLAGGGGFPQRTRTVVIASAVSLLMAVPFFQLNATVEPQIARFRSLLDERILSRESYYLALNHLSKYYYTLGEGERINELWEGYSAQYPSDWRGYRGLAKSFTQLGNRDDPRIWDAFARWAAAEPGAATMHDEFLRYCFDESRRRFQAGDAAGALAINRRVIAFDTAVAPAWTNIGLALRAQGDDTAAVAAYERAVRLAPRSAAALVNLGNTYDDLGRNAQAISAYERAIELAPDEPGAYFNLGVARLKMRDTAAAFSALKEAARLGEPEAQELLRRQGAAW